MPESVRQTLGTALRGLLGIGLAAYLINLVLSRTEADLTGEVRNASTGLLVAALLIYGTAILCSCFRWGLLLRAQGIELGTWTVIRLTMIGVFFNLAVPGGVGGDLLKMVYARREAPDKGTEAVLTILLDRILGLLGLLVMALISVVLCWELIATGSPELRVAVGVVGVGCLGGLGVATAILTSHWLVQIPPLRRLGRTVGSRLPEKILGIVIRVSAALEVCRRNPGVLARALGLSLLVHVCISTAVYLIATAIATPALDFAEIILSVMVANTVAAIPITPGGLGGRDLVLTLFLTAAGAPAAKSAVIATLVSLGIVFWSLVGGVLFILEKGTKGGPPEVIEESLP